jgi:chromosome segregation ATPase
MSMNNMQWLLEVLLTGLLTVTLFHALRLEKALGVLRRDRAALEELIAGFNESTRQAEGGIDRLRAVADGAGRQIARHVDQAKALKNDLAFLSERGEKLADQLDNLVRQARPLLDATPSAQPAPMRPMTAPRSAPQEAPVAEADSRVRSQAEKDLLRALRMAR